MSAATITAEVPAAEAAPAPAAVVSATGLRRRYGAGETAVEALRGVSLDVARGKITAQVRTAKQQADEDKKGVATFVSFIRGFLLADTRRFAATGAALGARRVLRPRRPRVDGGALRRLRARQRPQLALQEPRAVAAGNIGRLCGAHVRDLARARHRRHRRLPGPRRPRPR
jgi:hypothetical protein